jgi:hypothetical protein
MTMQTITADTNTLMRQAPHTAHAYLLDCARYLDQSFGEGYAAQHPELLAAMLQVSAQDFHTACLCSTLQDQIGSASLALEEVSNSLDKAAAAMGETDAGMAGHERYGDTEALQRQSAQAVENYLVAAIGMLDRHLDPEFFARNPGLLGEMVKAMAIQHQAGVAARH